MKRRVFSFFLRISGLVLKLCLTLYMGRYLALQNIGTYGLVAAFSVISISLLGFRLDFVATREVINLDGLPLTAKIRDQYMFYAACYALLGATAFIFYCYNYDQKDKTLYLYAAMIGVLESASTLGSGNLVALQKPLTANFLFFIKSSLWIPPVIVLGVLFPIYRNEVVIFLFWIGGLISSILLNAWLWRRMNWINSFAIPINWKWIKKSLLNVFPIWVGSICLTCSGFADRFVAEIFLDRASVGIISFYSSFAVAVYNIMNSGVFSFIYPQLVKLKVSCKIHEFNNLAREMRNQAIFGSGVICLLIAVVVPSLCLWSGKKELLSNISILWGMLVGVWMKCATEYIYYICYAKEKDNLIWIGNFVFVISSTLFNLTFIFNMGLNGYVYSTILAVIPFCLWRIFCLKKV